METLSNEYLTLQVSEKGAEMYSLRCGQTEYLWDGNPEFWARHAPVLFPIVGRVWEGHYRSHGRDYQLGQHGFARDKEFTLLPRSEHEVWFRLCSDEQTLQVFPYPFQLEIGYRLEGKSVHVRWRVVNPGSEEMFFQIGAHPAFYFPDQGKTLGWFRFARKKEAGSLPNPLIKSVLTEKGCIDPALKKEVPLEDGKLRLTYDLFSKDALVLENDQVHSVELLSADLQPLLRVDFDDMPVVGLWSPPGKNAPFVCIEPWLGRCDDVRYQGDYEHKPWVNRLAQGEMFAAEYVITVL